jgi:EH domain-containing protein 1
MKLQEMDFSKFSTLKQRLIDTTEEVLGIDLPRLMEALPRAYDSPTSSMAMAAADAAGPLQFPAPAVAYAPHGQDAAYAGGAAAAGGPFEEEANPWGDESEAVVGEWALEEYVAAYKPQFDQLQRNGLVTGAAAKGVLQQSGLPVAKLRQIWNLADLDKDGSLDLQEFVIAMFLTSAAQQGQELPPRLDDDMVPPGKKHP